MKHLRLITARFCILLRQRIKPLIKVILHKADVAPGRDVQTVDPIQHRQLNITRAVTQVMTMERSADAFRLQSMKIFQRVPLISDIRQTVQVVKGFRKNHEYIRRSLRHRRLF